MFRLHRTRSLLKTNPEFAVPFEKYPPVHTESERVQTAVERNAKFRKIIERSKIEVDRSKIQIVELRSTQNCSHYKPLKRSGNLPKIVEKALLRSIDHVMFQTLLQEERYLQI